MREGDGIDFGSADGEELTPEQGKILHLAGEMLADVGGVVVDVEAGERVGQQLAQRCLEKAAHHLGDHVLLQNARQRLGDDAHAQWEQLQQVKLQNDRLGAETAEITLRLREEVHLVGEQDMRHDVGARLRGLVGLEHVVVAQEVGNVLLHDGEQLHDQLARFLRVGFCASGPITDTTIVEHGAVVGRKHVGQLLACDVTAEKAPGFVHSIVGVVVDVLLPRDYMVSTPLACTLGPLFKSALRNEIIAKHGICANAHNNYSDSQNHIIAIVCTIPIHVLVAVVPQHEYLSLSAECISLLPFRFVPSSLSPS